MMNIKNKKCIKYIACLVFVCVIYFIYYTYVHSNLVRLTDLYESDSLNVATQAIESNIGKKINEVQTIAEINFKYKNSDIDYNKIISVLKDTIVCESIFIGDINGKCISDKNEIMYMQEYKYFQDACDGKTTMSEPLYSYNDKKWVTAISSPVRNYKGEIEKILVVFYDINELKNIMQDVYFDENAIIFITTMDKVVVLSNSQIISQNITKTGTVPDNNSELAVIKNMQDKAIGILEGQDKFVYNGEAMKTFFKPFKNNDWILISSVPEKYLYKSIDTLSIVITIVTLIAVLITSIFALHFSKINRSLKDERKRRNLLSTSSNIVTFNVNVNGGIGDFNSTFAEIVGLKESELKNCSIYSIIPESYYSIFSTYFEKVINCKINNEQLDMPILSPDGKWTYILWNSNIYDDEFKEVEFIGTNISTLKEYEKRIQKIAYFDQLTGLNNIVYLEEYFESVTEVNTTNSKIALMYIDIDNFKYINDMFGHNIGDNFIIDLSNRLLSIENIKVKVCKRSGDEFVIFYEYVENQEELDDYIEKVFDVVKKEYYINNVKINISISMGIGMYPDDAITYTDLFKCADIALQVAKDEGKNRVKYFNNAMQNEIYELISIENDLKSAVENNEFVLYYQPQYNINTGELYGFEALIRWLSPKKGFVQPDKFIPQAEKNQLIIPIGKFAFTTTCDFINELIDKGYKDLCISVNVSVVQMMCDDFVDFVLNTIEEKNINTKNIKLEITESVLIKSIDETVEKINILNKYGIQFSLDDFGTGYSSLAYLKQIPLNVLKIDKSFTDTILEKNTSKEILSLIIDLAQKSNLSIVAEGIEEKEQLKWLESKGCDIAQGFYMGKPMPKDKVFEIIGKNMYDFIEYDKNMSDSM